MKTTISYFSFFFCQIGIQHICLLLTATTVPCSLNAQDDSTIAQSHTVDFSLYDGAGRFSQKYNTVYSGNSIKVVVTDVNRLLYQCHFTEFQKKYREIEETSEPEIVDVSGPKDNGWITFFEAVYKPESETEKNGSIVKLNSTIDDLENDLLIVGNKIKGVIKDRKVFVDSIDNKLNELQEKLKTLVIKPPKTKSDSTEINNTKNEIKNLEKRKKSKTDSMVISIDSLSLEKSDLESEVRDRKIDLRKEKGIETAIRHDSYRLFEIQQTVNEIVQLTNDLRDILLQPGTYSDVKKQFDQRMNSFKAKFPTAMESIRVPVSNLKKELDELAYMVSGYQYVFDLSSESNHARYKSINEFVENSRKEFYGHLDNSGRTIVQYSNWIENPKNFECSFTSAKLKPNSDALSVIVDIKPAPKLPGHLPKLDSKTEKLDFRAKKGIKIDFSAGFAFHPGVPENFSVIDQVADIVSVSDSTSRIVLNKSKDWLVPSAVVLASAYVRRTQEFNLGVSVGAGTNLRDISYYLGISFLFGREDMFLLTGGLVLSQKQILLPEYRIAIDENEGIINAPRESVTSNPLYLERNPYRLGTFISLTYSFTQSTEKEAKQHFVNVK